jgi:hypothetical protein
MLSLVKGPYYRHVGRHTQRFCRRAVRQATNEAQKRVLMISAVAADESVATLLDLGDVKSAGLQPRIFKTVTRNQATDALRVYLSALLVLLGGNKEQLLHKTCWAEAALLNTWCWVFEYRPADMELFDQILLPAYSQHGITGLAAAAGKAITETLFSSADGLHAKEIEALAAILADDAAALIRNLEQIA